jgi:hypothetical protein
MRPEVQKFTGVIPGPPFKGREREREGGYGIQEGVGTRKGRGRIR